MAEIPDTHLTKDEVAARLRVSKRTVETLMSTKQLGYVKVGRCVRIPSRAVTAFLEGATRSPDPQKPTRVHTARAVARKTIRH
jgi:excisionase family DNA binding protein